jgi:zinc D-Ala-D-Ala carboxypeptidase
MMKKISKHISYKEATNSSYALKYNIKNKPSKDTIETMGVLAEKVFEPLREWADEPIRVNSFYRSEAVNKGIKGSLNSQHLTGNAIDISSMGEKTNAELFYYIKDNIDFDQLIWEYGNNSEPKWIHASYTTTQKHRGRILKILRKGRYTTMN